MKAIINLKADTKVKKDAQKTAAELGLTLSAIINAYLKQFIRTKEIYFSTAPRMTPALERLVGRAERDLKAGRNVSPTFSDADEAIAYLHSKRKKK
jgi:addiction module RelB/DinJ family antitoxin